MSEPAEPAAAPTSLAFAPRPALVALAWVITGLLLATTLLSNSPEGRILSGIATIAIGVFALFGTVARPRLTADERGVVVRRLGGSSRWSWPELTVKVSRSRRFGRDTSLLELDVLDTDGDEHLVVLGWLDLGTTPDEVAEALRGLLG
ncbi:MAG TPA: PH domain-containing protein [Pseudonocardiaceae bacterium]|nr:PH domain-containing protein [Pseudonocardiaceae bacterium]